MTDVLERLDESLPTYVVAADVDTTDRSARTAFAALAVSGGAIHLAMAPGHLGESTILGAGFIAAGWLQLSSAWLAITKPSKRLWTAAIGLNVALIATWAVARTVGLPLSGHAGDVEDMTIVDLTTVALEVVALLLALRLLLFRGRRSLALGVGIPVIALVAATTALASPDARGHGEAGAGHHDEATPAVVADAQERGFGSFMNGGQHAHVSVPLDPATQAELDRQLAITSELAAEFPTLQDAVDAGYRRAGPYVPGLGVHMIKFEGGEYLNPDGIMSDDELRKPLSLLYTSAESDAELGGFMYYSASDVEPVGFPGRNDGWHVHQDLCMVTNAEGLIDFPFGPDFGATQAQCDSIGGTLMDSQWMTHVWTVPGWDDMADWGGVFAEAHPKFGCSDGTWFVKPFEEWKDDPLNTCQSGASGIPEL